MSGTCDILDASAGGQKHRLPSVSPQKHIGSHLKAQRVASEGIYCHEMAWKIHLFVFSDVKSLKINNLCFHSLITSIYIHGKSRCKEAITRCRRVSTVAQNVDLLGFA